jgi:hypothetical protein
MVCTVLTGLIVFSSCKKDGFYTKSDAKLQFSESLITFDTVFTSVSTITKILKVKNPYKTDIKTDIVLVGGATSYFSINVDGIPAQQLKDVEIPAQDSIFIFIKANINPNGVDNPMLACDTLAFTTNGNRQNVELLAYGQDAHFILPVDSLIMEYGDGSKDIIPCNIVAGDGQDVAWKNDKPYVIYGYAFVSSNAKLTIEKGTRVYVHKGGILWVFIDGCLEVNGTKDEPVAFQGDRLESWYEKVHAQWDGIWLCESNRDSKINYAVIKNSSIGIQAESLEAKKNGKLILTNTVIQRAKVGLWAKTYTIEASNNVFTDCVQSCVALTQGGDYTFVNNTIYNLYTNRRKEPTLYISNYYTYSDEKGNDYKIAEDFSATFINNIVSGISDIEFSYSQVKEKAFSAVFENCLLKTDANKYLVNSITHTNTLLNKNPEFEDEKKDNLKLKSSSPCKKAGKPIPWLQTDIEGNSRNSSSPSIGAYE